MDWQTNDSNLKLNRQQIARNILQIYEESLQDQNKMWSILSTSAILEYFGKTLYGRDEICSHLIANLQGSSFELSSLITDNEEAVEVDSMYDIETHRAEEELGVSLMSIPSTSFPGLSFATPVGTSYYNSSIIRKSFGKRSPLSSSMNYLIGKRCKLHSVWNENGFMEAPSLENRNLELSPEVYENSEMRYLSSFGTIYYAKQVLSTTDPKRIKHHSIGTPRQRFCHLYINFKCDEHFRSISNCKISIIRYRMRSKMTPRNLLKSFTENDYCQSASVSEQ